MVSAVQIAQPKPSRQTDPLKDAGIVSDVMDLYNSSGALDTTLNSIGLAASAFDVAVNPIKTAVSWAVNWIISHIDPLPDMLQQYTGDPEKVEAAALTWERIGAQWTQAAAELEAAVAAGLDAQVCRTLGAYKVQIGSIIETFRSMGDACRVVAKCLNILSAMVKIVYDLTREAIGDLIGTFVQSVVEAVGTVGLATPAIVAQISATVSKWVTRITSRGKKVLSGFRQALGFFENLKAILKRLGVALKRLFPDTSGVANGLKGAMKAGKHKLDGAVEALKSKIKSSDEIIDGVARRRKASIDGRLARVDQDAQRAKDALDARKLRVDQEAERMKAALDARKARLAPDSEAIKDLDMRKAFIDQRARIDKLSLDFNKANVDQQAVYEKFALKSSRERIDESAEAWKKSVSSAKDNIREGGEKLRALHGATLQKPIDVLGAPSDAAEALGKEGVRAWYRRFGTSEQVAGVEKVLKRDELFDLPMKRQRKWIENLNDHKVLWDKSKEVYEHWGLPSQNKKG